MAADAVEGAWKIDRDLADGSLWSADPVLLVKKHEASGFKFTSSDREAADSRLDGGVTFFGRTVYETKVAFAEGAVSGVEIGLFNKGGTESVVETALEDGSRIRRRVRKDSSISRDDFMALLAAVRDALTPEGAKPPKTEEGELRRKGVVAKEMTWAKSTLGADAKLAWSYSQTENRRETFEPGFIRFTIEKPSTGPKAKKGGLGAAKNVAKGVSKIVDNVVKNPNGDVFIDNVPMVDQGMKGYCAVATSERVLRYYGVKVDEHELAQAAGTSAEGGTSTLRMKDSVAAVGRKYRLATVVKYGDFDKGVNERIAGLNKEVEVYNKAAKRLKKKQITDDMYIRREGNMISYNPAAVDEAMEVEVLKYLKVNGVGRAKYNDFLRYVKEQVTKGIPLFWGVKLGIYPEPEIPQANGGHMRLIIGYNEKKKEILYSDSWGAGHELKRMSSEWAWTITRCVMFLRPLVK